MEQKIRATFAPILLDIKDDSAKHAGHAGHDPRGETHFSMIIVSDAFEGLSKVERHRLVYQTVAEEMAERVHALSLKTLTQSEHRK